MKKIKLFISIAVIISLFSCNESATIKKINEIEFKSLSMIKKEINGYKDLGEFTKIIKPEIKNDFVIGRINSISVDKKGSILIADYRSSKTVFLYDKSGNFIRTYGKYGQGPGEYVQLMGSARFEDGSVVLVTPFKIIKYNKDGRFLKEIRHNNHAIDSIAIKDKLYLSMVSYRDHTDDNNAVIIYNSDLKKTGGINKFDTRLYKTIITPVNTLASINESLAFIDIYNLKLQIYNPISNKISILKIPNDNDALNFIWNKKRISKKEQILIMKQLHCFGYIYGFNNNLLLWETGEKKKRNHIWLLNINKKKIITFSRWFEKGIIAMIFGGIKGSYNKGLIIELSFNSEAIFNKYKKEIPLLRKYTFNMDDNSFIAFFKIKGFE